MPTAISFGFRVRRDTLNGYSFGRWCENLYGISCSSQKSVGGLTGGPVQHIVSAAVRPAARNVILDAAAAIIPSHS